MIQIYFFHEELKIFNHQCLLCNQSIAVIQHGYIISSFILVVSFYSPSMRGTNNKIVEETIGFLSLMFLMMLDNDTFTNFTLL